MTTASGETRVISDFEEKETREGDLRVCRHPLDDDMMVVYRPSTGETFKALYHVYLPKGSLPPASAVILKTQVDSLIAP